MSVIKIDLKKTEAVESDFEISAGSNTVVGSLAYTDDFPNWLDRAPLLGSEHPDYPALKLEKIKASRQPGDLVGVKLEYASLDPSIEYPGRQAGAIKRYDIDVITGEEPLLTNGRFSTLTNSNKEAIQQLLASSRTSEDFGTATTAVASDTASLLAIAKIRKGVEAYLNPGIVWIERFSAKDLSGIELDKVGNIMTPPGSPPDAGTRTWLYIGATGSQSESGEEYAIERRWQLSEKGGWDTDLYTDPA